MNHLSHPSTARQKALTRREALLRGGAGLAALDAIWLLAACGGGGAKERRAGATVPAPAGGGQEIGLLTWAINSDATSMDYALAYDYSTLVTVPNVTEPLLRFDVDGGLVPNLAEAWEQVDDLTYVYTIRSDVKFHDGSELTAEDVAFSLNRHRDPDVGSYLATFHDRVARVEASGPLEVTVKLSEPDALWKYAVGTMAGAVTSKAFVKAKGKDFGKPKVGTLGTGPYRFESWTPGQQVVLERFDGYWNRDRPLKVKRFVSRVLKDEATLISALASGDVDGTFTIAGRSIRAAQQRADVYVASTPSYALQYLAINTQQAPFDDVRVRQALSYALDKAGALRSVFGDAGELTKSPAPAPLWTFAKNTFESAYTQLPAFERDVDKAKRLIREAGAEGAQATMLVSVPVEEELGVAVQAAAKEIGLDLKIEKLPQSDKYAQEFSGKADRPYALSVSQWASDVPDPAGTLWLGFESSNRVTNTAAYRNPQVDRLLARQLKLTDEQERAKLLTEAQAIIVDEQPWIVFYSPNTTMVAREHAAGYKLRPLWYWDTWIADLSGNT